MNRGGGGNEGMTRGLFATMPERADTKGSHWSKPVAPPLHSTSSIALRWFNIRYQLDCNSYEI
jgi:hypothetical protein